MAGYTKLFNSILASTIWRADDKTRIVWITLLAMADKRGVAEGSVPGLADFARVSIPACRRALEALSSPDPDSRSQEHEGRRIQAVDGGWQLLNYDKYRERLNADERREYFRLHKQRQRALQRVHTEEPESNLSTRGHAMSTPVQTVQDNSTLSTQAEAEAEAEAEAVQKDLDRSRVAIVKDFDRFWAVYPRKVGRDAAWREFLKLRPSASDTDTMIAAVVEQQTRWDDPKFIPHPRTWLHQGRWKDESPASSSTFSTPSWRDVCRSMGHHPECQSIDQHRLRETVAARGCTHPGVCRSHGEHAQKIADERKAVAS